MFPVVWLCLYVLLGVAAALIHLTGGWAANVVELAVFLALIVALGLWTIIFCDLQSFGLAFFWQLIILGLGIATCVLFWLKNVTAGALVIPLLVWVAFATLLAWAVWRCNPCWTAIRHDFSAKLVSCQKVYADAEMGFNVATVGSVLLDTFDPTRINVLPTTNHLQ